MKIRRRALLQIGAASLLPTMPAIASVPAPSLPFTPDSCWLDDVSWVRANGSDGHTSTYRAPPNHYGHRTFQLYDAMYATTDVFEKFFYGAGSFEQYPEIAGLSARYNTRDPNQAQNAVNVLHGDGWRDVTSVWVINWNPRTIFGITPDGLPPSHGSDVGLVTLDWRYAVRIANVTRKTDLGHMLIQALMHMPTVPKSTVIYLNHDLHEKLGTDLFRKVAVRTVPLKWDEPVVA